MLGNILPVIIYTYRYISYFLKVCNMPIHFYKRTTLVPIFTTRKKSKEDFTFMKKSEKRKQHSSVCFARSFYRGSMPWVARVLPPSPFPEITLGISAPSCQSFELHEHLCFISIYFVCLLSRCALRWLLLHYMPFQFKEGFQGTLYFHIVGRTCLYSVLLLAPMYFDVRM